MSIQGHRLPRAQIGTLDEESRLMTLRLGRLCLASRPRYPAANHAILLHSVFRRFLGGSMHESLASWQ